MINFGLLSSASVNSFEQPTIWSFDCICEPLRLHADRIKSMVLLYAHNRGGGEYSTVWIENNDIKPQLIGIIMQQNPACAINHTLSSN